MLVIASSDGFCSFVKIEVDLIGQPLEADSELIPEYLRDYYKQLNEVSFKQ